MKIFKFILLLFLLFALLNCSKEPFELTINKIVETPFTYEIISDSRQIILTQANPWESQNLLYYNVIKKDSLWQMWYMSTGKEIYNDYFGAFCYAYSNNGENWYTRLPNQENNNDLTNILMSSFNTPVVEQYVFFDDFNDVYRMIGVTKKNGVYTTNIWSSNNGLNWYDKKVLFNNSYDSQFSVIRNNGRYYIYQRLWYNKIRAVGRSVVDLNFNIIEKPKLMLVSSDKYFPHIYNNSASKVYNLVILFPTLLNDLDGIKITLGFEYENLLYLTGDDITEKLYWDEDVKWGIVSPGLIPTGEEYTYWLYYYGNNSPHISVRTANDSVTKYYRIKIRIIPKQ